MPQALTTLLFFSYTMYGIYITCRLLSNLPPLLKSDQRSLTTPTAVLVRRALCVHSLLKTYSKGWKTSTCCFLLYILNYLPVSISWNVTCILLWLWMLTASFPRKCQDYFRKTDAHGKAAATRAPCPLLQTFDTTPRCSLQNAVLNKLRPLLCASYVADREATVWLGPRPPSFPFRDSIAE